MSDVPVRKGRSHGARLKQATPWAVGENIVSAGASFASSLIVARLLDPRQFGLAAIAITVAALLHTITVASVAQAFVRTRSTDSATVDRVLTLVVLLGLLNLALCWLAGLGLAWSFAEPRLAALVGVQGIDCLLLAIASVPTALLTRKLRTRALALRTFGFKLASIAVTIALAIGGAGAWALVLGIVAGDLVSCVLLWRSQLRLPRWRMPGRELAELYRMSLWIVAEQTASALTVRGFLLVFGHYHGLTALGLLNFAIRLVDEIGNLISTSVSRVALAFFSAIHRSGQGMGNAFIRGTHAIMLISAPMLLGLAAVAPDLVPLLFGEKWRPAIPAVQLLAVFWTIRMSRLLAPSVMRAVGVQRPLAINAAIALVATAIALYATRDALFTIAVAAYGTRTLVTLPVGLRQTAAASGVSTLAQVRAAGGPVVSALVMGAGLLALRATLLADFAAFPRLCILVPVGVLIYATVTVALDLRAVRELVQWFRPGRVTG